MGRVKDRARYALIPRRPFRLFAEGTLSEQAMLEVCRFFGRVDAAVAAGTFDAEALDAADIPAFFGVDPEAAQIAAEVWSDGVEQTESRRRAERERMAKKRSVAPTSASVAPTSASVAPTSAQREYEYKEDERNKSEGNLPESKAHAGAAACGTNAAALPGASSPPTNAAAPTSDGKGASGLLDAGEVWQGAFAFDGLTRTDARQAEARPPALRATVLLLRTAKIAPTDERYEALIEAVKAAGASRGWTALRPVVEKHADAAAGGADALAEIKALLGEVSQ